MDGRKCKGAAINGLLKYIKKKWGEQGLRDAMKVAGIARTPRDGEWMPVEKRNALYEWLIKNKGQKQVYEAARHAARDLGIFSFLFSFVGVEKLLEKARLNYSTLYNYGEVVIEKQEERKVRVVMKGVGTEKYLCDLWEGAIQGLMDITKSGATLRKTAADAPDDCAYIIRWN